MNNFASSRTIWIIGVLLIGAGGCSSGDDAASLTREHPYNKSSSNKGNEKFDEKNITWRDALANASALEHEVLSTQNLAYRGLLDDKGAIGRTRMDEWGYPTPKELLRTMHESDESLKRRADAGDIKAQLLYADRLALRLEQSWAGQGTTGNHTMLAAGLAGAASGLALRTSHNPFSVLVYGRVQERVTRRPEAIAAALTVANEMGDIRAKDALEEYQKKNPGMDASMIARMIDDMNKTARR